MSESLRSEIIGLLSNYDVAWDDDDVLTEREIQFRIGDQPVVVSFDAAEDVPALLSNKLQELGVSRKDQAPPEQSRRSDAGRYVVFRSDSIIAVECEHGLTVPPGNILIIPLNRPNRLLNLTKEQFQSLFLDDNGTDHIPNHHTDPIPGRQEEETIAVVEPPEPPPPPPPPRRQLDGEEEMRRFTEASPVGDVFRFLEKQREPLQTVTVASRLHMSVARASEALRELQARGAVVLERGFWRLKSRAAPTPPPPPPEPAKPPREAPRPVRPNPFASTSRLSVPPQLGRILAAMAYARKVTGREELTTHQVRPYLPKRDMQQYSARLPGAIQKGLVARGKPLGDTRGWHYKLTPTGLEAARQVNGDIYVQDSIDVPDWLDQMKG